MTVAVSARLAMPLSIKPATSKVAHSRSRVPARPKKFAAVARSSGYESAEEFDPYINDKLTHSITGEEDMAIFFLFAGTFFMFPVMAPGVVLIIKAVHESIFGPL